MNQANDSEVKHIRLNLIEKVSKNCNTFQSAVYTLMNRLKRFKKKDKGDFKMTEMEIKEKLESLKNNETLMEAIVEAETAEELVKVFEANELKLADDITAEEAFELVKSQINGELNENDLDSVNGGIMFTTAVMAAGAFILGASEITVIGSYAYYSYKNSKKKKNKK